MRRENLFGDPSFRAHLVWVTTGSTGALLLVLSAAVMIPLFVGVTRHSLRLWAPYSGLTQLVANWIALIVALWYVVILAAIWFEFGTRVFG